MSEINFKFNNHPGDFFRSCSIIQLPDPEKDTQNFLIQFLKNYQSDDRVAFIEDLYKLLDNDFYDEQERNKLIEFIGPKNDDEIMAVIKLKEKELINDAYKNFYHLIRTKQIQIIKNGKN